MLPPCLQTRVKRSPHLAGHRGFSELFAEVQQGVEGLLARGRRRDDLREMKGR